MKWYDLNRFWKQFTYCHLRIIIDILPKRITPLSIYKTNVCLFKKISLFNLNTLYFTCSLKVTKYVDFNKHVVRVEH